MRLFIAEKPSAAKAIAAELGTARRKNGFYDCGDTWVSYCIGHLFEQREPDAYLPSDIPKTRKGKKIWRKDDLPIIPKVWKYSAKSGTKDQLKILGELIKKADEIVHAGDLDREGQAIIDHVLDYHKCKVPVKRFLVSAQDSVSIKRALHALKDNHEYEGWRNAALARQRADWLVGMNLTRAYTLEAQARGDASLLVVGRVQSPTLALVVERDRLIENFIAKDFYTVEVTVDCGSKVSDTKESFVAQWIPDKEHPALDEENRLLDKTVAELAANDLSQANGEIDSYKKQAKTLPQPLGLSLADITLLASNQHSLTADETLRTLQSLYETHKLCSYPRSDCSYLPTGQRSDAKAILDAVAATYPKARPSIEKADLTIKSRIWNDSKVTAHHAIVPTMHKGDVSKLSAKEQKLYNLIVKYYLAQFYPKHAFDATTITVLADGVETNNRYLLKATGRVITEMGWKSLFGRSELGEQQLPVVEKGKAVRCVDPEVHSKRTTPPKHFTDGTLIKALEQVHKHVANPEYKKRLKEEDGIGTPATRSSIIADLKKREYLAAKGKYLISTELGRRLIDTLPESVTSPVMTAQYERELHSIQNDKGSLDSFVQSQVEFIKQQIADAATHIASNPAPPKHKAAMRNVGKSDTEKQVQAKDKSTTAQTSNAKTYPCPQCEKPLIRRQSKFKGRKYWWGCSGYPECKQTLDDNRGKPEKRKTGNDKKTTEYRCPKCDSPLIRRKSTAKPKTKSKSAAKKAGKVQGYWYGCSAFPKCKERFRDKGGSPEF